MKNKRIRKILKENIVSIIANSRFKIRTINNKYQNMFTYVAPPDPYKKIQLNPDNIEYILRTDETGELLIPNIGSGSGGGLGQIRGGNWDLPKYRTKIEDVPHDGMVYFKQRFEDGKAIKETDRYQYIVDSYNNNTIYNEYGFNSVEDFARHILEEYDKLYYDIKKNGYKNNDDDENIRPHISQRVKDQLEPLVTIDRWGNIHHWEGQNRMGIARVLDLEISVQVICRHKKWQSLRDQIYTNIIPTECSESIQGHPDLQDVTGSDDP